MFVRVNFVDIYLQGMRDRSMQSGTELGREIKLTDWSMAGNQSNRSSGVQIPCDICTRLKRYLYSAKCSWIIKYNKPLYSEVPDKRNSKSNKLNIKMQVTQHCYNKPFRTTTLYSLLYKLKYI